MHKSGLLALADTYGLDRRELQQLKHLAEAFFTELRAQLANSAATAIALGPLTQTICNLHDLCAEVPACRLVFLGSGNQTIAMLKSDGGFARALVDCMISGKPSQSTADRNLTTIEEFLLSNTMASACGQSATRTLAAQLGIGGELRRIEAAADTTEQVVLACIACQIGGAAGTLELALPLSRISKARMHPVAARASSHINAENHARAWLADARAEMVAVLGELPMSLEELRTLKPGSILSLGALQGGIPRLSLHCGGHALFSGAVVEHRGWRRFLIQQAGVTDERSKPSSAGL